MIGVGVNLNQGLLMSGCSPVLDTTVLLPKITIYKTRLGIY